MLPDPAPLVTSANSNKKVISFEFILLKREKERDRKREKRWTQGRGAKLMPDPVTRGERD